MQQFEIDFFLLCHITNNLNQMQDIHKTLIVNETEDL